MQSRLQTSSAVGEYPNEKGYRYIYISSWELLAYFEKISGGKANTNIPRGPATDCMSKTFMFMAGCTLSIFLSSLR